MALLSEERYALCPLWQNLVQFWPHELVALTRNSCVLLKIFPNLELIWLKADPLAPFSQLLEKVQSLGSRQSKCELIVCLEEANLEQIEQLLALGADEVLFLTAVLAKPIILPKTVISLKAQKDRILQLQNDIGRQQKALQSKADFVTWLSHEIRTPMNGVLGMTDLLQQSPLTLDQMEMVEVMGRSGRRVVDLLSEILDMSRIEAGKMNQHVQDFQLRRLIEDSITLYAGDANLRGLVIGNLVDRDVPDSLLGDERKLGQILNNLISNAVKYTSTGHVLIFVRVEAWEGEYCRLLIEVQDTGHGIAAEELNKVFAVFEQTQSSAFSRSPSSGLGLSLTKNLVELLGGSIHLKTRLGEGSTFSCSMPFLVREEAAQAPDLKLLSKTAVVFSYDQDRLKILKKMLELGGIRVMVGQKNEPLPEADWYFFGEQNDWNNRHHGSWTNRQHQRAYVLRNPIADRLLPPESRHLTLPQACEFIDLPLRQSDLYRRLSSEPSQDSSSPSVRADLARRLMSFQGARILVVDDDPVNLQVAERQLKRLKAEISLASSGVDALEWLEKKHFDLIFVDCQMPHMDGFEFVKILRQLPQLIPGTPVIALTALGRDEDRERALQGGFSDFLAKPAQLEDVQKLLGRWLPREIKSLES